MKGHYQIMNYLKNVIKLSIIPIFLILVTINTSSLINADMFNSIQPKIKQEYSDYLSYKNSSSFDSIYDLYNSYTKIPVYKLMAIDIFLENPCRPDHFIKEKIDDYYNNQSYTESDRKKLSNEVSTEINKLKEENNKIRKKQIFFITFISVLLSVIISCLLESFVKKKV